MQGTDSEVVDKIRKKVICVVSKVSKSEYKQELDNIEETDPKKIGGSVEFVFAVNKLSEGWDVDNVFQIVPMEERTKLPLQKQNMPKRILKELATNSKQ